MIHRIVDLHQPGAVVAAGFGLSERCACKWLARFRAEGAAGLADRSSRPKSSPRMLELQHSTFATMERHVLTRAQQTMRPELYARISEKLVFNKLTYDVQLEIARLLLAQEVEILRARGHSIDPSEAVLSFLVRRGFHPRLGARPMRDAVEKSIGDAVANELLTGGTGCGKLTVDESGERLRITL